MDFLRYGMWFLFKIIFVPPLRLLEEQRETGKKMNFRG